MWWGHAEVVCHQKANANVKANVARNENEDEACVIVRRVYVDESPEVALKVPRLQGEDNARRSVPRGHRTDSSTSNYSKTEPCPRRGHENKDVASSVTHPLASQADLFPGGVQQFYTKDAKQCGPSDSPSKHGAERTNIKITHKLPRRGRRLHTATSKGRVQFKRCTQYSACEENARNANKDEGADGIQRSPALAKIKAKG